MAFSWEEDYDNRIISERSSYFWKIAFAQFAVTVVPICAFSLVMPTTAGGMIGISLSNLGKIWSTYWSYKILQN